MNRILLVDDDKFALKTLSKALADREYDVVAFDDPAAALAYASSNPIDLVIADYLMPRMDGVRFLVELEQRVPGVIALLVSATSDPAAVVDGYGKAHIYRYLVKPWVEKELRLTVADALNHHEFMLAAQRAA